jgi:hypothetical protein
MLIRRLCSTESWPFGKGSAPPSKSVIERGRERLRPSGKRTTKKSGPREDRSATTGSVCPNKGWRAETTRTWDTNLSTTVAPWVNRGSDLRRRHPRSPCPQRAPHRTERRKYATRTRQEPNHLLTKRRLRRQEFVSQHAPRPGRHHPVTGGGIIQESMGAIIS